MGYKTQASGSWSTAMGEETIASGFWSTTMGSGTQASGSVSTAMGQDTTASGYGSMAMGDQTIASGDFSTALGGLQLLKTIFLLYRCHNKTDETPNPSAFSYQNTAFVIGNGGFDSDGNYDGHLSNAFEVLFDGKQVTSPPLLLLAMVHSLLICL